jgi:hypothetical protein
MIGVWFAQIMGEELGPLSDDELRALAANRRLAPDDMIRKGFSGKDADKGAAACSSGRHQ